MSWSSGGVINKRTGQQAAIKPLDGDPMDIGPDDDPRQKLVDWMVEPKNPFFARAVANRYWAHFFGRGIVDPLDYMRVTNPPSNVELLDALAKELVEHKYSLKHLIATICKSRTYQLSSVPNDFNKHDKQAYARYYPKRMGAEVLFDAVCQVTDSPTAFGGLPQDKHAPKRASKPWARIPLLAVITIHEVAIIPGKMKATKASKSSSSGVTSPSRRSRAGASASRNAACIPCGPPKKTKVTAAATRPRPVSQRL